MKVGPFCTFLILSVFAAARVFPQSATNTGSIYGKVLNSASRPLSGVRVGLESNMVAPVSATTSEDGNFHFGNLLPGTYSLSFFLQGFMPVRRKDVLVSIGERVEINEILELTSENTGVLVGFVTDQNGIPLQGASVSLESDTIPQLIASTAQDGSFRFEGLPAGTYRVVFRKKNFLELKRENIEVPVKDHVRLEVQLVAKSKPEKVSGSEKRSSTGISWTYSGDYLRMLPNGDSIYAILDHTPAIDSDTFSTLHSDPGRDGEYATVVARGSDYYSTVWNYDGLNITPPDGPNIGFDFKGDVPSFFNLDNAEQVQIITAGNDISIPTGGVTVNIVPKQGGRKWHGSGSFFFSNDALQSTNTPEEVKNDSRIETPPTTRIDNLHEYNFDLGGPVIADKLFIWGAFHQSWLDRFNIFEELEKNKSTSYNLKANWNLTEIHQFHFGYMGAEHNYLRDFSPYGITKVLHKPATVFPGNGTAQYIWTPENNTILRAQYGYFGNGVQLLGTSPDFRDSQLSELATHDVSFEVDRFAENLLKGDHQLRFGVEYRTSGIRDFRTTEPPLNAPFSIQDDNEDPDGPLTEGTIKVSYLPEPERSRIGRISFYASDFYRQGRLALDIGVRFDRQKGKNESVSFRSPLQVFGTPNFLGPGFENLIVPIDYPGVTPTVTFNNVSPRLGATYELWGNRRILANGSFARYYQPYDTSLLRFSGAFPPGFTATYKNKNNDQVITPDEIRNSTLVNFRDVLTKLLYDSHLTNPFLNEYVIGLQTELRDDLSISAAFTHRSYHDVVIDVPDGLTTDDFHPAGTTVLHTSLGDFVIPLFTSSFIDTGSLARFLRNNRSYTQSYDGFELMLHGTSRSLVFNSGFVLQRQLAHGLSKDFPPWFFLPLSHILLNPTVNYSVLENHPYEVSPKGLTVAPYSEWQLKLSGVYRFPWDVNLGAFLRYEQGYPFILIGFHEVLTAPEFGFFFWVEPIGKRRLDNVFTLDLRVVKEFRLKDYGSLDLSLEILNATNSNPILRRIGNIGSENLNMVAQFLPPRVMRFGFRYSF